MSTSFLAPAVSTSPPTLWPKWSCVFQYEEVKNFCGHAFDKKAIAAEEAELLAVLPHRNCPPALVAAARKLIEMGFAVLHVDLDSSMRRVALCHTLGANLDRRFPRGIFAEVTYVV